MSLPTPYYEEEGIVIYHGDCREILPLLPDKSVDHIVTDPPYGMNRFETDGKDYLLSVGPALQRSWWTLVDGGSMFVFTSTAEVVNVANALGRPLKRLLWVYKPADCTYPLAGWLLTSEAILWFAKGDHLKLEDRRPYRHDCYVHTRVGMEGVEGHPTVKPLLVVRDLANRCPLDGTILDPFLGSGTTLVAAKQLGRKAIGIEIEEKYCEIAVKRLAQEVLPFEDSREKRELEQLSLMQQTGHPDQDGLKSAIEDWIVEDAMNEVEKMRSLPTISPTGKS